MNKTMIRVGNIVTDPKNFNYILEADENVIANANLFNPTPITPSFIKANDFKEDIMDSFYKEVMIDESNTGSITLAKEGDMWRVSVRGGENVFGGYLECVSDLQNIVADCHIDMKWKYENKA